MISLPPWGWRKELRQRPVKAQLGSRDKPLVVPAFEDLFRPVVAIVAEALPVAAIPEQPLVTAMGHDVVDHLGGLDDAIRLAAAAERMLFAKRDARARPAAF